MCVFGERLGNLYTKNERNLKKPLLNQRHACRCANTLILLTLPISFVYILHANWVILVKVVWNNIESFVINIIVFHSRFNLRFCHKFFYK